MRRSHLGMMLFALPMLALSLALSGCQGGGDGDKDKKVASNKDKKGTDKSKETPVESDGTATLTGHVKFAGDKAALDKLTEGRKKQVATKNEAHCNKASEFEQQQQTYHVGKNNQVGNVFVWVEPADKDKFFPVTAEQAERYKENVVVAQPHCTFMPHAVILLPKYKDKDGKEHETGQKLVVINDAAIAHNAKVSTKGLFNRHEPPQIPPGKDTGALKIVPEKAPFTISCGIHPWMSGVGRAYSHPYATLTKAPYEKNDKGTYTGMNLAAEDFGTYELEVPAGVKLRLFVWHEGAGFLNKNGEQGEEIELKKDEKKEMNYEMAAK